MKKPGRFKIADFPVFKSKAAAPGAAPENRKKLTRREIKHQKTQFIKFWGTWFLIIVFALTSLVFMTGRSGRNSSPSSTPGTLSPKANQEEINHWQKELARDAYNPDLINSLGEAYLKAGKLNEAVLSFKQALKLDPKNSRILHRLATAYAQNRKFPEAIETYQAAIKLKPDNPVLREGLCAVYLQNKQPDAMIQTAHELLKLDPGNIKAYYFLGFNAMEKNNKKEAIKNFETALEIARATSDPMAEQIMAVLSSLQQAPAAQSQLPPGVPPPPARMGKFAPGKPMPGHSAPGATQAPAANPQLPPGVPPPPPGPPDVKPKPIEQNNQ
jgi:cytochrome c-type biogenesis protein CcmH/NrfG